MTELRTDICIARHRLDPDRHRRAIDGLYLCHGCRDRLEQLVAEMPARYDELGRALTGGGGGGGQRVSGSSSEPAPINLGVTEHRQHIEGVLASWARLVAEERGIAPPAGPQVVRTAPWLTVHIDWCAGNRWVDEMLTELRACTGRARAMLDPARRLPTGERCRVTDEDGEQCDGTITMRQSHDEVWKAVCSHCGPQMPGAYMADSVDGRWVTIERVEAYVLRVHGRRVARATVRKWVERERIQSREDNGKVWYELASVERYLSAQRVDLHAGQAPATLRSTS